MVSKREEFEVTARFPTGERGGAWEDKAEFSFGLNSVSLRGGHRESDTTEYPHTQGRYIQATSSSSIHPSMNIKVVAMPWLLWIMLL